MCEAFEAEPRDPPGKRFRESVVRYGFRNPQLPQPFFRLPVVRRRWGKKIGAFDGWMSCTGSVYEDERARRGALLWLRWPAGNIYTAVSKAFVSRNGTNAGRNVSALCAWLCGAPARLQVPWRGATNLKPFGIRTPVHRGPRCSSWAFQRCQTTYLSDGMVI